MAELELRGEDFNAFRDFDFAMWSYGNLYGALNDRGRSITLRP